VIGPAAREALAAALGAAVRFGVPLARYTSPGSAARRRPRRSGRPGGWRTLASPRASSGCGVGRLQHARARRRSSTASCSGSTASGRSCARPRATSRPSRTSPTRRSPATASSTAAGPSSARASGDRGGWGDGTGVPERGEGRLRGVELVDAASGAASRARGSFRLPLGGAPGRRGRRGTPSRCATPRARPCGPGRATSWRARTQPLDIPSCDRYSRTRRVSSPPADRQAGLRGARGGAEISPVHANFIRTRRRHGADARADRAGAPPRRRPPSSEPGAHRRKEAHGRAKRAGAAARAASRRSRRRRSTARPRHRSTPRPRGAGRAPPERRARLRLLAVRDGAVGSRSACASEWWRRLRPEPR
jgi:hypothetical protein